MKKLDYNHLTTGALTVDASHLIGVVNDLIDLVNSQQEAIERLQEHVDHEARHVSEPADFLYELLYGIANGDLATQNNNLSYWRNKDLQKALDEVQPNE